MKKDTLRGSRSQLFRDCLLGLGKNRESARKNSHFFSVSCCVFAVSVLVLVLLLFVVAFVVVVVPENFVRFDVPKSARPPSGLHAPNAKR